MKKNLLFFIALFILKSNFGIAQTKYKEISWDEIGLKFKVPSFIEIDSKDNEGFKLESEDFLLYLELVDEFDSLDELIGYYKVKKVIDSDENINEKTFKGSAASGFTKMTSDGDAIDVYNVFGNLQSIFNQKEKITFDINVYEFNKEIEDQLNTIMGSIEFYQKDLNSSKERDQLFNSSESLDNSTDTQEVASQPIKKKSFLSKMLDFTSPNIRSVVPFDGV